MSIAAVMAIGYTGVAQADVSAVEGQPLVSVHVADVTPDPGCSVDPNPTIHWGDNQSSTGSVGTPANGTTPISGSHTYAEEGDPLQASVDWMEACVTTPFASRQPDGDPSTPFTVHVADASLRARPAAVSPLAGGFTGSVASFSDADPGGTVTDYTAAINWGDGSSSSGTISAGAGGAFVVTGSHAYASSGSFAVGVSISDAGGSRTTALSTANVSRRLSTTRVQCSPPSVVSGQSAACTATATDPLGGGVTPTGTISFASNGPGGFGTGGACLLAGSGGSASCTVAYTPSAVGPGKHTITATYQGSPTYVGSAATFDVTVGAATQHPTTTAVQCSPGIVLPGHATSCTATVTDTASTGATAPQGTIKFSSDSGGSFSSERSCSLTGNGSGSASCSVSYTPGSGTPDTQTITALYSGDAGHASGSGFTTVAFPPQAGVTAVVAVVSGQVLISVPGSGHASDGPTRGFTGTFVPLKGVVRSVPVGSTVDVRKGVVRVTTAADDRGPFDPLHQTQSGSFAAAMFTIKQMTAAQQRAAARRAHKRHVTGIPPTDLVLVNPPAAVAKARCRATGPVHKGIVRAFSGVAKGFYRTIGAASTTIVHDASWIVKDRCDGTITEVGRGSATVQFTSHGHRESEDLHAGQAFFVKARFF